MNSVLKIEDKTSLDKRDIKTFTANIKKWKQQLKEYIKKHELQANLINKLIKIENERESKKEQSKTNKSDSKSKKSKSKSKKGGGKSKKSKSKRSGSKSIKGGSKSNKNRN